MTSGTPWPDMVIRGAVGGGVMDAADPVAVDSESEKCWAMAI